MKANQKRVKNTDANIVFDIRGFWSTFNYLANSVPEITSLNNMWRYFFQYCIIRPNQLCFYLTELNIFFFSGVVHILPRDYWQYQYDSEQNYLFQSHDCKGVKWFDNTLKYDANYVPGRKDIHSFSDEFVKEVWKAALRHYPMRDAVNAISVLVKNYVMIVAETPILDIDDTSLACFPVNHFFFKTCHISLLFIGSSDFMQIIYQTFQKDLSISEKTCIFNHNNKSKKQN